MKRICIILAFLTLGPLSAFGQTKEETMDFIVSEFKSFERKDYHAIEANFSPAGDTFTLKRRDPKHKDFALSFQMKDVEVYKVTVNHPNGIDQYRLMVRPRGRDGCIMKNSVRITTTVKLGPTMDNENQCRALERAFARLTTLTTARKYLFYEPVK
jgi:hypothetical protein